MKTPQFRVVPQPPESGKAGGAVIGLNAKCLTWLIATLKIVPADEKPKIKLLREALLRELEEPTCEARDIEMDPCT